MRPTWQDGFATLFVFTAGLLYVLWVSDSAFATMPTRAMAAIVFALGLVACLSDRDRMAVLYGPRRAGRPSTGYVVSATLVGCLALVTGVLAMVTGGPGMLAALVAATVLLWVMATTVHRTDVLARVRDGDLHKIA